MTAVIHNVQKRWHCIFDYNFRISWLIFYNFCTVGNGNEYSIINSNLLTLVA